MICKESVRYDMKKLGLEEHVALGRKEWERIHVDDDLRHILYSCSGPFLVKLKL